VLFVRSGRSGRGGSSEKRFDTLAEQMGRMGGTRTAERRCTGDREAAEEYPAKETAAGEFWMR